MHPKTLYYKKWLDGFQAPGYQKETKGANVNAKA
jgi:hypothetical protein